MSGKPLPVMTEISKPFGRKQVNSTALNVAIVDVTIFTLVNIVNIVYLMRFHGLNLVNLCIALPLPESQLYLEFAGEQLQILAVIELAEGVRMNSTLINVSEEEMLVHARC